MTLTLALILDALFGEPKWLWDRVPHPAILMGRAIGVADIRYNHGAARRSKGIALVALLCIAALGLGLLLCALPGIWIDVLLGAILLAHKSLIDHVRAVANALRMSVAEGREAVAMIVGRDTRQMTGPDVSRAAIESAAENFSDGVIAPALFLGVFGLPGLLIYKVVNTADSMIGYKTPRHADFGWAAARLDDVLNWIPARTTSGLIWLASAGAGHWAQVRQDARRHRSPNAGWPEAAIAPALDLALAGPRSYAGQRTTDPFVNASGRRDAGPADIDAAITLLWRGWWIALGCAFLTAF